MDGMKMGVKTSEWEKEQIQTYFFHDSQNEIRHIPNILIHFK